MLIDEVYSAVSQLVNKDQVSGYLAPDEYNKYAELAQREFIETNYARADGRGYESTFKMTDDLSGVKSEQTLTVSGGKTVNSAGSSTLPTDYLHFSHARTNFIFGGKGRSVPVELVRDDEWSERLASEVNTPSKRFPVVRLMRSYFEVYPQDVNAITFTYIKKPAKPWWNYTLSGSTPVFAETGGVATNPNSGVASGNSTDFEVDDFPWLVWRICGYFGLEVREADVYQASKNESINP